MTNKVFDWTQGSGLHITLHIENQIAVVIYSWKVAISYFQQMIKIDIHKSFC